MTVERVAHFKIVEELGRGGMGVVYKATDEKLRRLVALKVLPPDYAGNDERRTRFLREARSAAAVTHANVATVYDVGEDEGRIYIAMELVEGETVRKRLSARRLPMAEVVDIAKQITKGLKRAHEKGIVHRDLKPDNVMIASEGEVKILDFGLAKLREVDQSGTASEIQNLETASHVTEEGQVVGTPAYMSPEQATGRAVDHRTDLFSVGVMLYEMVAGRLPFTGESTLEVIVSISRDEPALPSSVNPEVPAELDRVIAKCLEKKAAARYGTADDLLSDLERIEVGPGAAATAASGAQTVTPAKRSTSVTTESKAARVAVVPSPLRSNATRAFIAVVFLGLAIGLGLKLVRLLRDGHEQSQLGAPGLSASAQTAGAARGVAVTDHADPKSSIPQAITAYRKGLEAEREGWRAGAFFLEATKQDPTLAAAQLRYALMFVGGEVEAGREAYGKALALRASLDERDQGILDAMEPIFHRSPADADAANARMRDLAARFPSDAELPYLVAHTQVDFAELRRQLARALELDPKFTGALAVLAQNYAYTGSFDRANEALERCFAVSSTGLPCLDQRRLIAEERGECALMEADARRALTIEPSNPAALRSLTNALAAQDKPMDAIRTASERSLAAGAGGMGRPDEKVSLIAQRANLAAYEGDFVQALSLLDEGARQTADDPSEEAHSIVAAMRLALLAESGDTPGQKSVAEAYLAKRDAWEFPSRVEDWSLSRDPTARMLAILRRAGVISPEQERARRDERLALWSDRIGPDMRSFIWFHFYAAPVETPEEAKAAIAAREAYLPLPTFAPSVPAWSDVGRTYFLAGQIDDALPVLEHATKACLALRFPIHTVRAHYFLGMAREAKGDKTGACEAYAGVPERWRHAKPRSVTWAKTEERRKALSCSGAAK